jgi:hypothetical protein
MNNLPKINLRQRYLGMSVTQLIILACLGLGLCGTLFGGYGLLNMLVAVKYNPTSPVLTEGPTVTPVTPAPTLTPLPSATPTPVPYESLIPAGWRQVISAAAPGMEIWFPPTYELYNASSQLEAVQVYKIKADDYQRVVSLLDTTQSPYLLYATFEAGSQPMPAADLDEAVDSVFGVLMRDAQLMQRDEFEIGNYPARKLVFSSVNAAYVIYPVQVGTTVWYLSFAMPFNEVYDRIPTFDQIARTFRVKL